MKGIFILLLVFLCISCSNKSNFGDIEECKYPMYSRFRGKGEDNDYKNDVAELNLISKIDFKNNRMYIHSPIEPEELFVVYGDDVSCKRFTFHDEGNPNTYYAEIESIPFCKNEIKAIFIRHESDILSIEELNKMLKNGNIKDIDILGDEGEFTKIEKLYDDAFYITFLYISEDFKFQEINKNDNLEFAYVVNSDSYPYLDEIYDEIPSQLYEYLTSDYYQKSTDSDNISKKNSNEEAPTEVVVIEIPEEEEYEPRSRQVTEPVQVWKQCWSCLGSGQCSPCFGQGYIHTYNGPEDCQVCTDGRCNVCAGQGGHYETEYQTKTVYY